MLCFTLPLLLILTSLPHHLAYYTMLCYAIEHISLYAVVGWLHGHKRSVCPNAVHFIDFEFQMMCIS